MANVQLNRFLASGTAAEMAAFTPEPPVPATGPDYGCLWVNTDDDTMNYWTGAAYAPIAATAGGGDVDGPAASVDGELALYDGTTGKLIKRATGTGFVKAASGVYAAAPLIQTIGLSFDGAGAVLATGVRGDLYVPFACTITGVVMLADVSGSAVMDIWKDSYANYAPTVADTITASAKPTISGGIKSLDTTLTGWTTAISAGDSLRFNLDSVATITRLTLQLTVSRTS